MIVHNIIYNFAGFGRINSNNASVFYALQTIVAYLTEKCGSKVFAAIFYLLKFDRQVLGYSDV